MYRTRTPTLLSAWRTEHFYKQTSEQRHESCQPLHALLAVASVAAALTCRHSPDLVPRPVANVAAVAAAAAVAKFILAPLLRCFFRRRLTSCIPR